jgi:hypothetical protein
VTDLPFALDGGELLEPQPRMRVEDGVVFGVAGDVEAVFTVAWLEEGPETRLDDVVEEDLARMLSEPATMLVDAESTTLGGVECVRTFVLDVGDGELVSASEQWRLLAAGRRWTVTAVTALEDQPVWGPRLAEIATTFRAT